MPLRITQKECFNHTHENGEPHDCDTWLKVEGTLYREDAELLEKICRDIKEQTGGRRITLDLADLNFLDSESASVLLRLKREQNINLEGVHMFIQKVIEITEAEARRGSERKGFS